MSVLDTGQSILDGHSHSDLMKLEKTSFKLFFSSVLNETFPYSSHDNNKYLELLSLACHLKEFHLVVVIKRRDCIKISSLALRPSL